MICSMALANSLEVTLAPVHGSRVFADSARVVNSRVNVRVRASAPLMLRAATSSSSPSGEQPSFGHSEPPRLENFSQSRLSRSIPDRTILQKAESALSDKCMALEGEAAYQCWEAFFEYEELKDEYERQCVLAQLENKDAACRPLERFENMVRQSGGANSLIDNLRMVAKVAKKKLAADGKEPTKKLEDLTRNNDKRTPAQILAEQHERHSDGGIPMTLDEVIHEHDGMMPDSPFTRVLRHLGITPPWFTHPPEHETD